MTRFWKTIAFVAALGLAGPASALSINGAGSTFIYPLASKWFYEYNQKTGIQFNYQSIGSGAGIRQLMAGTVDFGASDAFMSDKDLAAAPAPVLHIPATMGAVAVAYNVAGVGTGLKLDAKTLAGMFLGKITQWNDPAIAALNPGLTLPAEAVTIVHRAEGSGTTSIFTDYLSKVSPDWKSQVGQGKEVKWPAGVGAKGNEAVAGEIGQVEGSLGYVELAYALQNKMTYASLRNRSGRFVEPSLASVSKAAAGALRHMPADFRVSFTDAPGKEAYPICGFSWFLVFKKINDPAKGKAIVGFLDWAMDEGQKEAPSLLYPSLPAKLTAKIKKAIAGIQY